MSQPHLLAFGFGYSAQTLARRLRLEGWHVTGTTRTAEGAAAIEAQGITARIWPGTDLAAELASCTHILSSVPPRGPAGDPVLPLIADAQLPNLRWAGLLSTTGVYGDHGGAWVDEATPLVPSGHRGGARATQNDAWLSLGLPVHLFRLAGIYGPGRSAFDKLRDGTARRIVKPGQVFSRIHVDDIATVLEASIARPNPRRAYNVADDLPAPPQDVIAHAAHLLGIEPPAEIDFEAADLSPMARSFYADNKRVSNQRIKSELGVRLAFPDYKSGLAAILAGEQHR